MARDRRRSLPTGTLTFLFTDIEGSTGLLSSLGDRYRDLLERHAAIMRGAIGDHGGVEVGTEGDSFFAVFPSAVDAVRAAAESQHALAAASWPNDSAPRVRMGLHTGEGRLGGDSYVGLDVHRASRIAAAAYGGQVLLSDATRVLMPPELGAGVSVRDLGEHRFRGFDTPVRIWQLDLAGLPTDFPPIRSMSAPGDAVPVPLTSFVGRDHELAEVLDLVASYRLVTLTGPGGTGKTRLAVEAARAIAKRLSDGAFFADLSAIRQPDLVPMVIAHSLQLPVDPGGEALSAVRSHVRGRELLLVLDNFEQVVAAADRVAELLAAADRLRVLVTSRMPLGVQGEREYAVPPLPTPSPDGAVEQLLGQPAVDLFLDRARAVKSRFTLDEESARAVAGIVARLDGLPLAIELAATQVRVLPPSAIRSRLERHQPLAAVAGRSERQRTMTAAIAWSYDLLAGDERAVFARLSAFPAGCTLEAAEVVCDAGDLGLSVLDALAALVTKSLVRQEEGVSDGEARFGMLEPIAEYGRQRLQADFDAGATNRRLLGFFVTFAEEAERQLTGNEQAAWLDRCERERINLRRAVEWAVETGEADLGIRLASALWRFWQLRGPIWEGRQLLDALLAAANATPAKRARALGAAGGLAWWADDLPSTKRYYEEAMSVARSSGDERVEMEALRNLAFVRAASGAEGVEAAGELLQESIGIAERLGDRRGAAMARNATGFVAALFSRDYQQALAIFEESMAVFEELGERLELADTTVSIGNVLRRMGQLERARGYYLRGLDMAVEAGNRPVATGLLFLVAALESDAGRHERAVRLWAAAESLRAASGAVRPAVAHRLLGDPVGAARDAIGNAGADAAIAEGKRLDYETALTYAHGDDDDRG